MPRSEKKTLPFHEHTIRGSRGSGASQLDKISAFGDGSSIRWMPGPSVREHEAQRLNVWVPVVYEIME